MTDETNEVYEMTDETNEVYTERRKKWQEYLRSGKFEQGKRQLLWKTDRGKDGPDLYCCLGVGCELFRVETKSGEWRGSGITTDFHFAKSNIVEHNSVVFPLTISHWFGLPELDEEVIKIVLDSSQSILYGCNDILVMNFDEIADVVGWLGEPLKHKDKLQDLVKRIEGA